MKDKIFNAINNPDVTFFLFPTPRLRELIAAGEHPHIKAMVKDAQVALLEGKCLPVSKEDVLNLLAGKLRPEQHFLMTTGEIRVAGAVDIVANKILFKEEK